MYGWLVIINSIFTHGMWFAGLKYNEVVINAQSLFCLHVLLEKVLGVQRKLSPTGPCPSEDRFRISAAPKSPISHILVVADCGTRGRWNIFVIVTDGFISIECGGFIPFFMHYHSLDKTAGTCSDEVPNLVVGTVNEAKYWARTDNGKFWEHKLMLAKSFVIVCCLGTTFPTQNRLLRFLVFIWG